MKHSIFIKGLMLVSLVVFLFIAFSANARAVSYLGFWSKVRLETPTTGIGFSDYKLNKIVYCNTSSSYAIAQLTNVGDLPLTVTPLWIPDSSYPDFTVDVTPKIVYITANESVEFKIVVNTNVLGNYSGVVEFKSEVHLPENYTGNPSVPGATTRMQFHVIPVPIQPFPLMLMSLLIVGIVSPVSIGSFIFIRKRKHGGGHLPPKIDKPIWHLTLRKPKVKATAEVKRQETPKKEDMTYAELIESMLEREKT